MDRRHAESAEKRKLWWKLGAMQPHVHAALTAHPALQYENWSPMSTNAQLLDWIRRWLEKHAELSDASATYDDALSQLEVQLARLGALSGKRPEAYSVFYDPNDRVLPQPTDAPDGGECLAHLASIARRARECCVFKGQTRCVSTSTPRFTL